MEAEESPFVHGMERTGFPKSYFCATRSANALA